MGMDVYGKNPTNEVGEYFRNNVWWWRPLADYACYIAPETTAACKHWHTNDGDGLDADGAATLAKELKASIDDGRAESYIKIRDAELSAMPSQVCTYCKGTGVRRDGVGESMAMPTKKIETVGHPRHGELGWCNACDGIGSVRPHDTHYPLDIDNIKNFAAFLEACGGFEIC